MGLQQTMRHVSGKQPDLQPQLVALLFQDQYNLGLHMLVPKQRSAVEVEFARAVASLCKLPKLRCRFVFKEQSQSGLCSSGKRVILCRQFFFATGYPD